MDKYDVVTTTSFRREDGPGDEVAVPRRCTLSGFAEELARKRGLHLGDCEALTHIELETQNTLYHLTVLDPVEWKVLVRGGRFFPVDTPAYLCGSGYGGALLKLAWIGVGLCCEISTEGLRVVTSPVRDFRVVAQRLPGPF